MALIFRTDKGSALSFTELDNNFSFLQTEIEDINSNIYRSAIIPTPCITYNWDALLLIQRPIGVTYAYYAKEACTSSFPWEGTLGGGIIASIPGASLLVASGYGSLAHGGGNTVSAIGNLSHAEGNYTIAYGEGSHAEGVNSRATGSYSHAEGYRGYTIGDVSHAEGIRTATYAYASHAEGEETIAGTYGYISTSGGVGTPAANNITLDQIGSPAINVSSQFTIGGTIILYDIVNSHTYPLIITNIVFNNTNVILTVSTNVLNTVYNNTGIIAIVDNPFPLAAYPFDTFGYASHAEGYQTNAMAKYSHAEGFLTKTPGYASHAEGNFAQAQGEYSHAEGNFSVAFGNYSHAEGDGTQAIGNNSHAEGRGTIATADWQHASGQFNTLNNTDDFFVIGDGNGNPGDPNERSNAFGVNANRMYASNSIFLPDLTTGGTSVLTFDHITRQVYFTASNALSATAINFDVYDNSLFEISNPTFVNFTGVGVSVNINGTGVDVVIPGGGGGANPSAPDQGIQYNIGGVGGTFGADGSFTFDYNTFSLKQGNSVSTPGLHSHAEGSGSIASGSSSHAEGYYTIAYNDYSHAEGRQTQTIGKYSHAEGAYAQATGDYSHAEGFYTLALGNHSHVEGVFATASGQYSHAEGSHAIAQGNASHAEGSYTIASGSSSHAEGSGTLTIGIGTHAEGVNTQTGIKIFAITTFNNNTDLTWSFVDLSTAVAPGDTFDLYSVFNYNIIGSFTVLSVTYNQNTGNSIITIDPNTILNSSWTYLGLFTSGNGNTMAPNIILGAASHAEGFESRTYGDYSHAEGEHTQTNFRGRCSHAEGFNTQTQEAYSHAEGFYTITRGFGSHAEGSGSMTGLNAYSCSIAGGVISLNSSYGDVSSQFPAVSSVIVLDSTGTSVRPSNFSIQYPFLYTTAVYIGGSTVIYTSDTNLTYSSAYVSPFSNTNPAGADCFFGNYSHAEGADTKAYVDWSHAEGAGTKAMGKGSHAEGYNTIARGLFSHAEGANTKAYGNYSHAKGDETIADARYSHTEGYQTKTSQSIGEWSHTEGHQTVAESLCSHAEGSFTITRGHASHAEGYQTIAAGWESHAEGIQTLTSGSYSHAEGSNTISIGTGSHAEGSGSRTIGNYSHAGGIGTIAQYEGQTVVGRYNKTGSTNDYFLVGDGTSTNSRSNAFGVNNVRMYASNSIYFPDLTVVPQSYVLTFDNNTKRVYYTASSALTGTSNPISVRDEGNLLTSNVSSFNFTGNAVVATNVGNAVTVTINTGSAAATNLVIYSGSTIPPLTTAASSIRFTGTGVTTSQLNNNVTVTIDKVTPATPNRSIQFNDNNQFGGDANLEWIVNGSGGNTLQVYGRLVNGDPTQLIASGQYSHAEGYYNNASGSYSHAEGSSTRAIGDYSHAEGWFAQTGTPSAYYAVSIVSGVITLDPSYSSGLPVNFPSNTLMILYDTPFDNIYGISGFTVSQSYYNGSNVIVELFDTTVTTTTAYVYTYLAAFNYPGDKQIPGNYAHSEGQESYAIGDSSHTEGAYTQTIGGGSHAEGFTTSTIGDYSHAEGLFTQTIGNGSHAEGIYAQAIGGGSHAEGSNTQAIGDWSHAEGNSTTAIGNYSHAGGWNTVASGSFQTVVGTHNNHNNTSSVFIVGTGAGVSTATERQNAFEVTYPKIDPTVGGGNTYYGHVVLSVVSSSLNFPNDATAETHGVPLGGIYHTNGILKIRIL